MTPAQLDAIATKLLGWKAYRNLSGETEYVDTETHSVFCPLNPGSRADAMLVLEAMTKYARDRNRIPRDATMSVTTSSMGPFILITVTDEGDDTKDELARAVEDTYAAAIFQCAAKLVERV